MISNQSSSLQRSNSLTKQKSVTASIKKIASFGRDSVPINSPKGDARPVLITDSDPATFHPLFKLKPYYVSRPDIMNPIHLIHNAIRVQTATLHDIINVFLWACSPINHHTTHVTIRVKSFDMLMLEKWWNPLFQFMTMCSTIENKFWLPEVFKKPTPELLHLKDDMMNHQQAAMQCIIKSDFKLKCLFRRFDGATIFQEMAAIKQSVDQFEKHIYAYFKLTENEMPKSLRNVQPGKTLEWEKLIFENLRGHPEYHTMLTLFFQGMNKDTAKHCAHEHLHQDERLAFPLWKREVHKKYDDVAKLLLQMH